MNWHFNAIIYSIFPLRSSRKNKRLLHNCKRNKMKWNEIGLKWITVICHHQKSSSSLPSANFGYNGWIWQPLICLLYWIALYGIFTWMLTHSIIKPNKLVHFNDCARALCRCYFALKSNHCVEWAYKWCVTHRDAINTDKWLVVYIDSCLFFFSSKK